MIQLNDCSIWAMDEQLRSEFFGVYSTCFDSFVTKGSFDAEFLEEFIRFSSHNHTQSFSYGKETNLRQLIETKTREVFKEMETHDRMRLLT